MEAHIGDHVIVRSRRVGQADLDGEVVEVLGAEGARRYRVQWSDGRETITIPGTDALVAPGGPPRTLKLAARVDLRIEEDDDACTATASMDTERGVLRAEGVARRHPRDHPAPAIGEELAVGRALRGLADQLEAVAAEAIPASTDDPSHLIPL